MAAHLDVSTVWMIKHHMMDDGRRTEALIDGGRGGEQVMEEMVKEKRKNKSSETVSE